MTDDRIARCLAAVEQLATVGLAAARTEEHLAALLREVDEAVTDAIGRAEGPRVACGRGCASCCSLNVGTLAIEGAVVAGFLRRSLPPGEVAAVAARLDRFHGSARWLDDHERVRGGFRCPFLDARRACRIHPVRPFACRSVTSLDAADCERALGADDEEGPPLVRMHLLQKTLYDEALDVLRAGVRRSGLDARRRDVSGMTALFLADPDLLPAYLAGAELSIG
jgi:Fe-S-cluster containining protein